MDQDQIDLRDYVRLLLRNWKWIALGGFVAALTAFVVTILLPTSYEATATVAVVRSRTDVTFDEGIDTLDDYQLGAGRLAEDRFNALLSLADSNEVMQRVLAEVGGQLAPEARNIEALRDMVDSTRVGDLIKFTVHHGDPEVAALVANSWTQAYQDHVNQIYGGSGIDAESLAPQVVIAQESYDAAQQELQDFLADKQVLALTRTLERELAIKRDLLNAYQQSRVAIETNDANTSRALLNSYYVELNQLEAWLADAETLREQVRRTSGSLASSLGDTLALIMLRGRVYGGQGPVDLQLDLSNSEVEQVSTADVDNLINVLETRRETTQERITALTAVLGSDEGDGVSLAGHPLNERIDTLTNQIIDLETQLETEKADQEAERRELEAARDRAWKAYQALNAQQVEAEIQDTSGSNSEVRLADSALVPNSPVGSGVVVNTALAGVVGVMVTIGIIFFIEWWFAGEGLQSWSTATVHDNENKQSSSSAIEPGVHSAGRRRQPISETTT